MKYLKKDKVLYLDTNVMLKYLLQDNEQFIEQPKEYVEKKMINKPLEE